MRNFKSLFSDAKQFVKDNPVAVGTGVVAVGLAAYGISGIDQVFSAGLTACENEKYASLLLQASDLGSAEALNAVDFAEFERLHGLVLEQAGHITKVLVPGISSAIWGFIAFDTYRRDNK